MNTVTIDNRSPNDNFVINRSGVPVSISCIDKQLMRSFSFDLQPSESKRITWDVKADVRPRGDYSYDNLRFELGSAEKWEVRFVSESLALVMAGRSTPDQEEALTWGTFFSAMFMFALMGGGAIKLSRFMLKEPPNIAMWVIIAILGVFGLMGGIMMGWFVWERIKKLRK